MNIAVSACLLGTPCRYDGGSKPCETVIALGERHTLVPVCPEVMGGLSTPRTPSEIVCAEPYCVRDAEGADNTEAITQAVREKLIEQGRLVRRTLRAFPYARLYSNQLLADIKAERLRLKAEAKQRALELRQEVNSREEALRQELRRIRAGRK